MIRKLRNTLIFVFIGMFGYFGIAYTKGHYDPLNNCKITVKGDIINGNRKSLIEAIKIIKAEDSRGYKMLCQNIDTIYERKCLLQDPKTRVLRTANESGCFIKNTDSIHIHPQQNYSKELVKKRAQDIVNYARLKEPNETQ